MDNRMVQNRVIKWLVDGEVPPVRYLAMRNLLGMADSERKLEAARADMHSWQPLRDIVGLQLENGSFSARKKMTTPEPTFNALQLMARCGFTVKDECVSRAMAYIEDNHTHEGILTMRGKGSGIKPCYAGIFGRVIADTAGTSHELYKAAADWICTYQRYDHKETRAGGEGSWPYKSIDAYGGCWMSVSCYHGVIPTLRVLSAMPADRRSDAVKKAIDCALEYLRIHRVYKKSAVDKPLFRYSKRLFLFGAYRSNLLDVLEAVAEADAALINEPWVADAVEAVEEMAQDGVLSSSASYPTGLIDPLPLEVAGTPSRFLTYQWMNIKNIFGLT